MAIVTITLEDRDGSNDVKVSCTPKYEQMAKSITGGLTKSSAFSMALAIANFLIAREKQGRKAPAPTIIKPKGFFH